MATAILHPQNLLRRRIHHETLAPQPRAAPKPSPRLNRHACSATRDRRRKCSPPESRSAGGGGGRGSRSRSVVVESPAASSKLVMEQVKILKRGEMLSEFQKKERSRGRENTSTRRSAMRKKGSCSEDFDLVLGSTGRIGRDPGTVQKQIRASKGFEIVAGGFAGASCSVSPPPSSVPIPGFLGKKNKRVV